MSRYIIKHKEREKNSYTYIDIYKYYINYIGNNYLYNVEWKVFNNILCDYFKGIMDHMMHDNYIFKPGFGFGSFYIGKLPRKTLNSQPIDWAATKKVGFLVYHLNEESNRYIYRFIWQPESKGYYLEFLKTYKFRATRKLKRLLAKLIKIYKHDYVLIKRNYGNYKKYSNGQ